MPALCVTSSKNETPARVLTSCAIAGPALKRPVIAKHRAARLGNALCISSVGNRRIGLGHKAIFAFSDLDNSIDRNIFEGLYNARRRPAYRKLFNHFTSIETEV